MTYPCLRLCLGFSQTTRTRPFRRTILHLSQRFLTDDFTFIVFCVCERVGRGLVLGVAVASGVDADAFLIGKLVWGRLWAVVILGGVQGVSALKKVYQVSVILGSVHG